MLGMPNINNESTVVTAVPDLEGWCKLGGRINGGFDGIRKLLGVLLLVAAGAKSHQAMTDPGAALAGFYGFRLLGTAFVGFETAFALWLLSGLRPRETWLVAVMCFTIFAGVALAKATSGAESCGCFGLLPVNPWFTVALDVTVLVGLAIVRPSVERGRAQYASNRRPVLFLLIAMPLAVMSAASVAIGTLSAEIGTGRIANAQSLVIIEPEKWVGSKFPLINYVDIGDQLAIGNWIVILYRYDCKHCDVEIPRYKQMACDAFGQTASRRIAFVQMPPHGTPPHGIDGDMVPWLHGRLSNTRRWFAETPVAILLSHGKVTGGRIAQ